MRKISSDEHAAAVRIFRNVDLLIGKYYGRKTEDQIKGYVSANRWVMFPTRNIGSLRDAVSLPMPNVYTSFNGDEIEDNDHGQVDGNIGFSYHNVTAMLWLRQILRLDNKRGNPFMNILKSFDDEWIVGISNKTKVDYYESIPRYSEFVTMSPSSATTEKLQKAIKDSDNSLIYPGEPHPDDGHKVLSDITVFTIHKDTTEDTFDNDIRNVFELFLRALNLVVPK